MKRFTLFVFLLCLLAGCGKKKASAEVPEQSVPVVTHKETKKPESGKDDDWVSDLPVRESEQDILLRQTKYAPDGSVISWTDYSINADGRCIKSTPCSPGTPLPDGSVMSTYEYKRGYLVTRTDYDAVSGDIKCRYKYDAAGNEVKWILYDEKGEVSMWYEDGFDERGNLVSHVRYYPGEEGRIMNLREYDLDEHGEPTECRYVSEKGAVLNRYTFRTVYDAAGRVIEQEQDDVGGSVLVDWYRYAYDAQGRCVEEQQLDAGERCLIRRVYIYDEQGRLFQQQIYSSDGKLAVILENLWQ